MQWEIYAHKKLLCANKEVEIFYYKNKLCIYDSKTHMFIRKAALKAKMLLRLVSHFRIFERMLRTEVKTALLLDDIMYFTRHGYIYRYFWRENKLEQVHAFRNGMNNPISLVHITGVSGFDDGILYGEYWGNPNADNVNIYQEKQGTWERVYSFPKNSITHVHGLVPDSANNRVLILTGDSDKGSGIWEAADNFKTVKPLLVGKQQYRCCVAFTCEEGILYATDTPLEENYIYLLREDGEPSVTKLQPLPGPCIFGREYIDKTGKKQYIFATSVEPDSRIKGKKYLLTYKLGAGVKSRNVHILSGNAADGFKEIAVFKKDWLPMGLFQFGNVQFPVCDELKITGQSIKGSDGKTLKLMEEE